MAIFSLNHSFVGRTTHAPGSASLFARYTTGPDRCTETLGARMPTERGPLMQWLDDQEQGDRKNARVIDKVIVALPIELTHEQNVELVRAFGERMTEGRASWMAAIHDGPGDADNPHAHFIFRDRDVDTGKRVMLTSEQGSTQRFRDGWEQETNIALQRAGREERVDKRSLEEQGIDREAQIHVGAASKHLRQRSYEFESNEKEVTRIIHGAVTPVTVNYPQIDEGKTRHEENEERKQRNEERAQEALKMWGVNERAGHLMKLYTYLVRNAPPQPLDDGSPVSMVVRQHIEAQKNDPIARANIRRWLHDRREDLEISELPPRRDGMMPRRGPYADGPGKALEGAGRRQTREVEEGSVEGLGKGPRKDVADLLVGAGLGAIGKIAEKLESLFDGPTGQEIAEDEHIMAEERKIEQKTVETQQKHTEAEMAAWRRNEMQLYLEQRDRERHIDRGR